VRGEDPRAESGVQKRHAAFAAFTSIGLYQQRKPCHSSLKECRAPIRCDAAGIDDDSVNSSVEDL
jgi:hypothetical protein